MKDKLQLLLKEWQTLLPKIKKQLSQLTNANTQKATMQSQLTDSNRKLETTTKENTANEKVLNQIFTEMQQLAQQLN